MNMSALPEPSERGPVTRRVGGAPTLRPQEVLHHSAGNRAFATLVQRRRLTGRDLARALAYSGAEIMSRVSGGLASSMGPQTAGPLADDD